MSKHVYFAPDTCLLSALAEVKYGLKTEVKNFGYFHRFLRLLDSDAFRICITPTVNEEVHIYDACKDGVVSQILLEYGYVKKTNVIESVAMTERVKALASAYATPYRFEGELKMHRAPMATHYVAATNKFEPKNDAFFLGEAMEAGVAIITLNDKHFCLPHIIKQISDINKIMGVNVDPRIMPRSFNKMAPKIREFEVGNVLLDEIGLSAMEDDDFEKIISVPERTNDIVIYPKPDTREK